MTTHDRYRKIDTRIRADSRFQALSAPPPNARDLWIYLLTCGHDRSVPGLHSVGLAQLADEMEWSTEDTRRVWAEIEGEGMARADWRARVVWIPNALAHNRPQSINVVRSWRRAWGEISECALKVEAREASAKVIAEKSEALAEAFLEMCPPPKLRYSAHKSYADAFEKHEPMLSRSTHGCFRDPSPDEIETHDHDHDHDHQAPSTITKHEEGEEIPPTPQTGGDVDPAPDPISKPEAKKRRKRNAAPMVDDETHLRAQCVLNAWNEETSKTRLPPQEPFGSGLDTRDANLVARLKDQPLRNEAWWRMIFKDIAADPRQNGSDPRWRTQFHWLISKEENLREKFGLATANLRPVTSISNGTAPQRAGPMTAAEAMSERNHRILEEARARERATVIDVESPTSGTLRLRPRIAERRASL